MELRIGEQLIAAGVLDEMQCQAVMDEQRRTGQPFGLICERLYGVDPLQVEQAWARQYATLTRMIDPSTETIEPGALSTITRRQAWQFRVLPIRFDGDELMVATTASDLPRALCFVTRVVTMPTYLVVAEPLALGAALCRHYPMAGMTPRSLLSSGVDSLMGK